MSDTNDTTQTVTLSRSFDVSAQRLFDAWAIPEQTCRWMGPRSVKCRIDLWDFREGGNYELVMISDEGNEFPAHGTFETIDRPRRLALSWAWQHEDKMQGVETLLELQFESIDANTSELRLTHTRIPGVSQAEHHQEGWDGTLDCLADYLAG
jgi:uncharacterized protein YndB with AHSA1/START domain